MLNVWGHCCYWLSLLILMHEKYSMFLHVLWFLSTCSLGLNLWVHVHWVSTQCFFMFYDFWVHVHWVLIPMRNSLQYGLNVDSSRDLCSCLPGLLKILSLWLLGLWQYHEFRPQIHVKIYALPCSLPSTVSLSWSRFSAVCLHGVDVFF